MNSSKTADRPKVLVLMSTYNGQKYLTEQLESIKAQSGVDVTCLIRDDGSSDKTVEILEDFVKQNESFHLRAEENAGVISSFNSLISDPFAERFDFIAFCDQDDVWLDTKLIRAVRLMQKNIADMDKPAVYCSNLELVDSELSHIGYMRSDDIRISKYTAPVQNCATGCTMVFNSSARDEYLRGIGSFMEMHDYWMMLVGMYLGKVLYDRKAYIKYRQHGNNVIGAKQQNISGFAKNLSKTGSHERMLSDFVRVYDKEISAKDKQIITNVALANKDLKCRMRVLLDPAYHGYSHKRTLAFKFRAMIGRVY